LRGTVKLSGLKAIILSMRPTGKNDWEKQLNIRIESVIVN